MVTWYVIIGMTGGTIRGIGRETPADGLRIGSVTIETGDAAVMITRIERTAVIKTDAYPVDRVVAAVTLK